MSAVIGLRWKPGHVMRRDTESGHYEEVNSPSDSNTERLIQRALLPRKPRCRKVIPTRPALWKRVVRFILNRKEPA